jgi:hypothetical protein
MRFALEYRTRNWMMIRMVLLLDRCCKENVLSEFLGVLYVYFDHLSPASNHPESARGKFTS